MSITKILLNNRVRTIHGTLSMEGNPFTEQQVKAVMEGKPVIGLTQYKSSLYGRHSKNNEERLKLFKPKNKKIIFSRNDYMIFYRTISTATASRDLQQGVKKKILVKKGDKALAVYRFK